MSEYLFTVSKQRIRNYIYTASSKEEALNKYISDHGNLDTTDQSTGLTTKLIKFQKVDLCNYEEIKDDISSNEPTAVIQSESV